MAHTPSAIKHLRQTTKRTERNIAVKKNITYLKRQLLKSITAKDVTKAKDWFAQLVKFLDKAALKNVIKKNTASRNKSRLSKRVNEMGK
ncbi:MAG: 30S ribosomal protein S20 [bacterium]|nr:30S ribosomal protein S20 [bacterium]